MVASPIKHGRDPQPNLAKMARTPFENEKGRALET
jgi:hypothetical protein